VIIIGSGKDGDTVTMEDYYESICGLSNGNNTNDL